MNQLTRGLQRRLMYVENKDGDIDGARARIGWVEFSRSGRSVYYRGRTLRRMKGGGVAGNFIDVDTGEEYWVSGVKQNRRDVHWSDHIEVTIDDGAKTEYAILAGKKVR